jgi:aminocarboxymuconate-semialdehyde decarboxylase
MLDDDQAKQPRSDALRRGAIGTRTEPEAIDVHAHAMPRPLLEQLARDGHADLSDANQGILRLAPDVCGLKAGAPIPFPPEQHDVDARLAAMDELGVHIHAVSAPPFLFAASAPDDAFALDLTRRSNEALAAYVAQAPDRLVGLGTVPVGRPGAAEVAAFCLDSLGFAGATLGSAGGGRELDDQINEELWAILAERQVFALLHPSGASSPARLADHHLFQLLGYPLETTLAVARLIFGGVLDRHRLTLCLAHGGGGLASLAGRLDLGWERKAAARTTIEPPSVYLRRLWYDTAVFKTQVLRRLVEDMGAERILLGTDAPFDLADRDPRATVAALRLPAGDEAAILGHNARRLLRLR